MISHAKFLTRSKLMHLSSSNVRSLLLFFFVFLFLFSSCILPFIFIVNVNSAFFHEGLSFFNYLTICLAENVLFLISHFTCMRCITVTVSHFFFFCLLMLRCYLQKRVLNVSRGPAVRALRAQTDKREYAMEMKKIVEKQVFLTFLHLLLDLFFC